VNATEWSIQDLAKAAGTTSRTLRHYGELGLLAPSRVGANGYRYYDAVSLVRLQRILLLRDLGLGLAAIADIIEGERDTAAALRTHLRVLELEQARLARQIASVRTTLCKTEGGEDLMAHEVFDGFDHTQYKDEVVERWGEEAYGRADSWWRRLSADDKQLFQQDQLDIATAFGSAKEAGLDAGSDEVQAIAARHYEWVAVGWQGPRPAAEAFIGLGEMYAEDPRFAVNYDRHAAGGAEFVRDAMKVYAERNR
jgi:DNA-binding transcriptional MerR regulator